MSDNIVSFFCKLEIYVIRLCLIIPNVSMGGLQRNYQARYIEVEDVDGATMLAEYFPQQCTKCTHLHQRGETNNCIARYMTISTMSFQLPMESG